MTTIMAFAKSFFASSDRKGTPAAIWPLSSVWQWGGIGRNTEAFCHFEVEKTNYKPRFLRLDSTGEYSNDLNGDRGGFPHKLAHDEKQNNNMASTHMTHVANHSLVTDHLLSVVHKLFDRAKLQNFSQRTVNGVQPQSEPFCRLGVGLGLTDYCREYISDICKNTDYCAYSTQEEEHKNHIYMLGRQSNFTNMDRYRNDASSMAAGAMTDNVTSDESEPNSSHTLVHPMSNSTVNIETQTLSENKGKEQSWDEKPKLQNDCIRPCENPAHGETITDNVTDSCHDNANTYQAGVSTSQDASHTQGNDCIILQHDEQNHAGSGQSHDDIDIESGLAVEFNVSDKENEFVTSIEFQSQDYSSEQNSALSFENIPNECSTRFLETSIRCENGPLDVDDNAGKDDFDEEDDFFSDTWQLDSSGGNLTMQSETSFPSSLSLSCSRSDTTESMLFEVAHKLSACSLVSSSSDNDLFHSSKDENNVTDTGFSSKNSSTSICFQLGADDTDSEWSSDSDYDEIDDDSNDHIWNSFMACSDPYNPMSGWQCSGGTSKPTKLTKTTSSPNILSGSSTPPTNPLHTTTPECASPTTPTYSDHGFDTESGNDSGHTSIYNTHYNETPRRQKLERIDEMPSLHRFDPYDETPCRRRYERTLSNVQSAPHLNFEETISHGQSSNNTRTQKKVHFPTEEKHLAVTHTIVAWKYAYKAARKGPWEEYARDRCRFRRRIEEIDASLSPCLTPEHRQQVFHKLNTC